MSRFETAHRVESHRKHGEDRVGVFHHDERTVIVVADGAGGIGNGELAAETVIREVENDHLHCTTAEEWTTFLQQLDCRITSGESTAVVVDLRPDSIIGASVGDSRAWIVQDGELVDLTVNQIRKPLLGSGNAQPVGFSTGPLSGILIVATDGFGNYVKPEQLTVMVAQADFYEIPRKCVELVRLPSGDLWDDVGIVACRQAPPRRTRKRYDI